MNRYYDKVNNRLVYIGDASSSEYWDLHWDKNTIKKRYSNFISPLDYIANTTKKYIEPGGVILEGGCGVGQEVQKLKNIGYKPIGVDYAKRTVKTVNKYKPELDVRLGDVTKLSFEDNYFDAYWSFGVIEHFYEGYGSILSEMSRVVKKGGYLFVTFPHMSVIRRRKAKKSKYPLWKNNKNDIDNFYQFALDEDTVLKDLIPQGFELVKKRYLSGIKGLKDEVKFLKNPLQKIFDNKSFFGKAATNIISIVCSRFSSHTVLLVLKNKKQG